MLLFPSPHFLLTDIHDLAAVGAFAWVGDFAALADFDGLCLLLALLLLLLAFLLALQNRGGRQRCVRLQKCYWLKLECGYKDEDRSCSGAKSLKKCLTKNRRI